MPIIYKNIRPYVGRYALASQLADAAFTYEVPEHPVPNGLVETETVMPGLPKVNTELSVYQSLGALTAGDFTEPIFTAYLGIETPVPFALCRSAVEGGRAYFYPAFVTKADPLSGKMGDVHMSKVGLPMGEDGVLVRGLIVLAEGVRTAGSGESSAQTFVGGVPAGSALYVSLHVLAATLVAGTVDIEIESDVDDDFASPTVQHTFSDLAGRTEEWVKVVPVAPITDESWRVTWSRTGGTSFSAVVLLGVGPA